MWVVWFHPQIVCYNIRLLCLLLIRLPKCLRFPLINNIYFFSLSGKTIVVIYFTYFAGTRGLLTKTQNALFHLQIAKVRVIWSFLEFSQFSSIDTEERAILNLVILIFCAIEKYVPTNNKCLSVFSARFLTWNLRAVFWVHLQIWA